MNLQRFDEAANAFYEGVLLSPESKELIDAFRFVRNTYGVDFYRLVLGFRDR